MGALPSDCYEICSRKDLQRLIKQSIEMNSTSNLFWHFYDTNRRRCLRYATDPRFRQDMGQEYLVQCYLDATVAKKLINKRPIEERLRIYKQLRQGLSGMVTGEEFDKLEQVVLPNPFDENVPCSPWGTISKEERLKTIAEQHERIDDFVMSFLG